jgi:flagella basal body P-ring formation protein FlgA
VLQPWLPAAEPAAPPTWCEIKLPRLDLTVESGWSLELVSPRQLKPGRNLLQAQVKGPNRVARFTVTVLCHVFGEVGRANGWIASGTELSQELFTWEWQDLSQVDHGLVVGRTSLQETSARRDIDTGSSLRQADLKRTPVIRQGEPVDLVLRQGAVQVKVRGTARQDGLMNQTITVRNHMTGRLVTGRVIAPGLVAWGR